ncbi:ArnT family glycosyltransferase [Anditalea andensis]|uniref:Glycosyltransferase RgtA/B/C/D-like domain-containing protein n=1 Tax=Anditalea andensis TaxID=1048983 RepID=A0A074LGW8_9BACT|nr:glycosyltransferase family 39 protein [Anditalea andensis]KEO73027.1 hypothetical protein EL17_15560 [Anditalea andensis]
MANFSLKQNPRSAADLLWYSTVLGIIASFIFGLFVPLMDSDAAHHANIALRMVLTGDYISLIDKGQPYLDKPHLLFWLSAISFKVFGVNTFAYKLPSLLFTILGLFSTFRLALRLYNRQVGYVSVLILSSAFAFVLANSDVRMDAILAACMIFTAWRFYEFYHERTWLNMLAVALGLALGFMTKGMIGPAVPTFAFLFYLIEKKDWKPLLDIKLYLILPAFFLMSSPVLYAYYMQYDLHPELIIRGRTNISGISFILWDQNFERFDGEIWGEDNKKDYFFFIHTILWAFLPWPILFYMAIYKGIRSKVNKLSHIEWMTLGTIVFLLAIYSFAGFKLPHYLNTLFPFMSILTAAAAVNFRIGKTLSTVHLILISLVLILVLILNFYFFPMPTWGFIFIGILMAGLCYVVIYTPDSWKKLVLTTALIGAMTNVIMQVNFYPKILTYQGGSSLAKEAEMMNLPHERIFFFEMQSFSFDFSSSYLHPILNLDNVYERLGEHGTIFLYVNADGKQKLEDIENISSQVILSKDAYHVSRLKFNFIHPDTRPSVLNTHYIVKVTS